jgi:hypothetical protein
VFGNVGSIVSFRVGADDGSVLQKYFEPQFDAQDLIQLHNRYFVSTMQIKGEKTQAFSGSTLNIPSTQTDFTAEIIENSRSLYAASKAAVDEQIIQATGSHYVAQRELLSHVVTKQAPAAPNVPTAPTSLPTTQPTPPMQAQAPRPIQPEQRVSAPNHKTEHTTNNTPQHIATNHDSTNDPHKKRPRLRKKKPGQQNQTNYEHKPVPEAPSQKPANHGDLQDQHVINLR